MASIHDRDGVGIDLGETNEYDEIFAALKHPVRRQILLFLGIAGLPLLVPFCIDINLAVEGMVGKIFSTLALTGFFLLGLGVMIAGAALFTLYDRHYFSKDAKTSIIHSAI